MRSILARSLAVTLAGFAAMAIGPARADQVFNIGSSFIISGTNAPNDFANAVTLSPGSTFIDGGALVLTQNIVNESNGEWLVLDVQTSNGSDIAGNQTANWGISQSGIQLATPSDWTERYFDLGADGALASPVANLSNQTSGTPVFVAPNPITGVGTVFLGTQTLASNATSISHGTNLNPFNQISETGINPAAVNLYETGLFLSPSLTCTSALTGALYPKAEGPYMAAIFSPNGTNIAGAEKACDVSNFDWEQSITVLPSPSPYYFADDPGVAATAPPKIQDPPPGGWVTTRETLYCNGANHTVAIRNGDDASPLYYAPGNLGYWEPGGNELDFLDLPSDVCLSGMNWSGFDTSGLYMEFQTTLVGIDDTDNPVALPVTDTWDWVTTFNGTSGGDNTLSDILPPDPGSGTGDTAIISINGAPVPEPPSIILLASSVISLYLLRRLSRGCSCATYLFAKNELALPHWPLLSLRFSLARFVHPRLA